MKTAVVLALVALCTAHPVSQSLTETINNAKTTWTAMAPEENPFSYMSEEEIKGLMGTQLVDTPEIKSQLTAAQIAAAPKAYNFVEAERDCVHDIRDQASCGSCWAFGAAEALTDRFCLASGHKIDVELSTEDMIECDKLNFGCNGGMMFTAWRYLEKTGIVTEKCYGYHSGDGHTEECHTACDEASETWKKYQCKAGSVVHPKTTEEIKAEISANGPMELAFTVYEDFMSYRTGVYQHTTGKQLGGHAVEVVGYGEENGVEYWLCANSWNKSWGEDGYFKIAIGDSGSSDQIYACTPEF